MPNISKSRYLSGVQCVKRLYYDIYQPELAREMSIDELSRLETGHAVGQLARLVFPGGLDATPQQHGDYADAIRQTRTWIDEGAKTIYEAAFAADRAFAALDILHMTDGEIWAIEVKATTDVKDYHITDCAFQYWVMSQAGIEPDKMFLMHLDKTYALDGAVVPDKLLMMEDITTRVTALQAQISGEKERFIDILSASTAPVQDIGIHCKDPFECRYKDHCWQHIPTPSVFDLSRFTAKAHEWYQSGIVRIEDLPGDARLTSIQQIQVKSMTSGEPYTDTEALQTYMSCFQAPLHFFDFETINPAIPILVGTSPYAQVPFQFSLYLTDLDGEVIDHHAYLAEAEAFRGNEGLTDPRRSLINAMRDAFGRAGTIVSYNKSFEENVIKALAKYFPDERGFLESLLPRFVDLLEPFRSGWYYTPAMLGSFSIKSVLPALVPEMNYSDLAIQGGAVASDTFHAMISGKIAQDDQKIRQDLVKYCDRDTAGMIAVYRHLKGRT